MDVSNLNKGLAVDQGLELLVTKPIVSPLLVH